MLKIVRHGQASFHADDYDQLSPLGEEQARMLGLWWLKTGQRWDRVFIGPKRRHRQTMDAVAQAFSEADVPFPEAELIPELDEHQGPAVVRHVLNDHREGEIMMPAGLEGKDAMKQYFRHFQKITLRWVRGELDTDHESWATFRDRVRRGIGIMTETTGQKVVAFTSGGPVAVSAGVGFDLSDEQTITLSWQVRNIAFNEFLYTAKRFTPVSVNALPHLTRSELQTLV